MHLWYLSQQAVLWFHQEYWRCIHIKLNFIFFTSDTPYNSYIPCLLCLFPLKASYVILSLCKGFCIHALEDNLKLDNLNRAKILISLSPLFESGTKRLFARSHREKPAEEPRNKIGFFTSQVSTLTTSPAILSCLCLGSWIINLSCE